jgi:FkbM family methyltransferase
MIKNIPPNATVIDVGANIGTLCLPLAKCRPDVKIFAIEASAGILEYLNKNIAANNLQNITVIHKAVSNTDGELVAFNTDMQHMGKSRIVHSNQKGTETIDTITIDSLIAQYNIQQVAMLKVDVEGYEAFVFQGASKSIHAGIINEIIFEFFDEVEADTNATQVADAQTMLMNAGYQLYSLRHYPALQPLSKALTQGYYNLLARRHEA